VEDKQIWVKAKGYEAVINDSAIPVNRVKQKKRERKKKANLLWHETGPALGRRNTIGW